MERPPEAKKDEQCPLLKIDVGYGEIIRQPAPVQTPTWSVTCAPKKSWLQRWPELISISWMTFILLGMSLLIFYALGMAAYRRQPLFFRYNDGGKPGSNVFSYNVCSYSEKELISMSWMTFILLGMSLLIFYALGMAAYRRQPLFFRYNDGGKPGSNVFLHHIIQKGCHLSFALYSPFLSLMAQTYPNLRFNVFFLMDDAMRNNYYLPRHSRLSNRLLGYPNTDEILKQEEVELERRYPNINITIMPLNKYMAMTPLRFKWRTIPVSYLTFYTRAFAVWQNGGIGMDFTTYNNHFCNTERLERRLHEIMKNHNKGLPITDYNLLLQAIDEEEDNSLKCLKQILNDTISMINSFFSFTLPIETSETLRSNDTPVKRTQRAKRNSYKFYEIVTSASLVSTDGNILSVVNATLEEKVDNMKENNSNDILKSEVLPKTSAPSNLTSTEAILDQKPKLVTTGHNKSSNGSEGPQAVAFFDFSIMSDKIGHFLLREPLWPPFVISGFGLNPKTEMVDDTDKKKNTGVAQLALDSEGLFIAATDKMHPFLGMLISAGFQRMRPEFAIQDTFINRCSGAYKNEAYCNIYRL